MNLLSSLFVKTFIAILIPYPSEKLIKENEIRAEKI
jgi:hypothetical protein